MGPVGTGKHFLSLVFFGGRACVSTNLECQFSVILREVYRSERSVFSVACFLTAFSLPVIELNTIEARPFEYFCLSCICFLCCHLLFSIIFHRCYQMEWFRHCHLRELVLLSTFVQEDLDFVGANILQVAVHELVMDRYWRVPEEKSLDVLTRFL